MNIRWADGWKIRNTIETDFNGWADSSSFAFIPRRELWIESYMKPELASIKKLITLERRMAGKKFSQIRSAAKKLLTNPLAQVIVLRTYKHKNQLILEVDGASVRRTHDPYFIAGGHDLIYDYIPKHQIWIDMLPGKQEAKYTLAHEQHERQLMASGMAYDDAHDFALAEERRVRRKDKVANFMRG